MKKKELYFVTIGLILTFSCFQYFYKPELKSFESISEEIAINSSSENIPTYGWKQNWAGPHWDSALKMAIDSSDNIHITGYSEQDLNDGNDFLYLKYNKDGTILDSLIWDRNTETNVGRDIVLDSSNNVYIAGYTDVDAGVWDDDYNTYLSKLSSTGVFQWDRIWGGSNYDVARAIALDSSENIYLAGLTRSYGAVQADALLMKYSNTGTLQWNQTYGGIASEWINSIVIDSFDNIYLVGGFQYNDSTDYDTYLIKVDNNGIEQWTRSWGGVGDELGVSMALDSSGNVYIVGSTTSYSEGYDDLFLLKYNNNGNLIWNITYGTENSEAGWPITIDWQDSIYVGGELYDLQTSEYSIFVAKFNQNGNQLWNMTYDISESSEYLYDMKISSSGDIYLTGGEYFSGTTYMDVYLMKFNYKLSEFVLISPEDKAYTGPMSGYYLNTYGFENDAIGETQPERFNNQYSTSCSGGVISEIDGHKRAFRAYDNNGGGAAIVMQRFNEGGFQNQTHGTIEYWLRVTSTNVNTEFRLNWGYGVNDASIVLRLSGSGQWQHNNGTWNQLLNISNPLPNIWYHIKIHFRCQASPSYLGISEDHYEVVINGESSGSLPFTTSTTEIAMFMPIYTAWGAYGGNYAYCDALGYSWDPNYNIGDNLNEGLLLDFKSKNQLEWKAYSLDSQSNVSIIDSLIIPLPDDGPHIIQVFGNDSLGKIYETEKRPFVVDTKIPEIMILSPLENKVYGELAPKYNLFIDEENLISAWYTIDGGITNFSVTDLNDYIDQDAWLAASDGPITVEFYAKDIVGRIGDKIISIIKDVVMPLTIEISDFFFSTEVFNLTFYIYNETGDAIDFADTQIWWDGIEVSSYVQNLGDGLYFISLDPITVVPGQDPIILQIIAFATGYDGKYFEIAISVDPDTLQKDTPEDQQRDDIPVEIITITVSLSSAAVLGGGVYILMRRRKKLHE